MNTTGQLWQYAIVAIALAVSLAGVLLHLFPRLHAGTRRALDRALDNVAGHPAMPKHLQRAAQRWIQRRAASPRGGCAGCASRGADAPRAIATVAMPARRSTGRGQDQAR